MLGGLREGESMGGSGKVQLFGWDSTVDSAGVSTRDQGAFRSFGVRQPLPVAGLRASSIDLVPQAEYVRLPASAVMLLLGLAAWVPVLAVVAMVAAWA